jgi:hypothetical protein
MAKEAFRILGGREFKNCASHSEEVRRGGDREEKITLRSHCLGITCCGGWNGIRCTQCRPRQAKRRVTLRLITRPDGRRETSSVEGVGGEKCSGWWTRRRRVDERQGCEPA